MKPTYQRLIVKSSRASRKSRPLDFKLNSGATYSLVPASHLRALRIKPYRKLRFMCADGSIVSRQVGDAYFEYRDRGGAAPVIFGEDGDEPLLGSTALSSLGLVFIPSKRKLYPAKFLLMQVSQAS